MQLTVKQIAEMIHAGITGDGRRVLKKVSSFEDTDMDSLTFASDFKFLKKLHQCNAGAVIIPDDFIVPEGKTIKSVLIRSCNPKHDFFKILRMFHPEKRAPGTIAKDAYIGADISIGKDVSIYSNVYVGDGVELGNRAVLMPNVYIGDNVKIGQDTVIKPNTTIMENCLIGSSTLIHSGTVVGSDGFGFTRHNLKHEKIIHAGYVLIGDHVEIGACNTIDRGTFGKTWIKDGVKTDNLVHIAHNVIIGENSLVVAQAGVAGSAVIGSNVIIAGQAGISGHLTVGDNSIIGPRAGVLSSVEPNEIVSGMPQIPHRLWLKASSIIARLPDLRKKLFSLEKRMEKIEKK